MLIILLICVSEAQATFIPLTIQELDGSPSVTKVKNITFNGATLTDLLNGRVLVTITGGAGSAAGASGAIQFNNSNALGADSSNLFWDDTNNRLGIGTNNPSQSLDIVSGDAIFSSEYGLRWQEGSRLYEQNSPTARMLYQPNQDRFEVLNEAGTSFTAGFHGALSGLPNSIRFYKAVGIGDVAGYAQSGTLPTNGLVVAGNVGIGVNTPVSRLHVDISEPTGVSSVVATIKHVGFDGGGTSILRVNANEYTSDLEQNAGNNAGTFRYGTYLDTNLVNNFNDGVSPFGNINFVTNGSIAMTIAGGSQSGLVGIGTTTPSANLDIRAMSSSVKPLVVRGASSQTANLQEWQSSSSAVLGSMSSTGNLLIGTSTPSYTHYLGTTQLQLEKVGWAGIQLFSNLNGADGSYINLIKSRGSTVGSTTAVLLNDILGGLAFSGYDGSQSRVGSQIKSLVDDTVTSSSVPSRIEFETVSPSGVSPTVKMTIKASGNVGIGTANPARKLHISEAMRLEPQSSPPTSPALGDLYVDSDTTSLCYYNGSSWTAVTPGGCS